jgi:hypothetical protein
MAKQQTSFSSEDAEVLLKELQQFREIFQQEWSRVLSQWSNLKINWRDDQFDRFEPLFEKMAANYNDAEQDCDNYIEFLQGQIRVADERKSKLGGLDLMGKLEKTVAGVQIFSSLAGMAIAPPTQRPPTPSDRYNMMPGIMRNMSAEDQLSEAYSQQQEAEAQRRQREIENSAKADNKNQASGSPPKE